MLRTITAALILALSAHSVLAQDCSVTRFGTDAGFEPFLFRNASGDANGFEVDLVKEICTREKLTCEFVVTDFDALIPSLLSNKIDVAVATMSITESRKQQIAFSDSYANPPARFVGKKGATFMLDETFLRGKTVGVMRGQTSEDFMRTRYPDVKTQLYDTQDNATLDLQNGRVDFVLNDAPNLYQGFLSRPEGAEYDFVSDDIKDPLFGSGYGFGLRKDDPCRLGKLNAGLISVRSDGTYGALVKHWFTYHIE